MPNDGLDVGRIAIILDSIDGCIDIGYPSLQQRLPIIGNTIFHKRSSCNGRSSQECRIGTPMVSSTIATEPVVRMV